MCYLNSYRNFALLNSWEISRKVMLAEDTHPFMKRTVDVVFGCGKSFYLLITKECYLQQLSYYR